MEPDQATEILTYLINQLNSYGFGSIVAEINSRLTEDFEEKEFQRDPGSILIFYLQESINIFDSVSNKKCSDLLENFNENIEEGRIENIQVELLSTQEERYFDLKNLPDYSEISTTFKEIISIIYNAN